MKLTIDSNVFVEAFVKGSPNTELCRDFLLKAISNYKSVALFEPALLAFEVCTAVSRATSPQAKPDEKRGRIEKAKNIFEILEKKRPNWQTISVDLPLWHAWKDNIDGKILVNKTQDEIFLFVAQQNGATFVTLDKEIKPNCSAGTVKISYPYEILKELSPEL